MRQGLRNSLKFEVFCGFHALDKMATFNIPSRAKERHLFLPKYLHQKNTRGSHTLQRLCR